MVDQQNRTTATNRLGDYLRNLRARGENLTSLHPIYTSRRIGENERHNHDDSTAGNRKVQESHDNYPFGADVPVLQAWYRSLCKMGRGRSRQTIRNFFRV